MQKTTTEKPKYLLGHKFVVLTTLELAEVVTNPDKDGNVRVQFTRYLPEQENISRVTLMSQTNIQRLVNFKSAEVISDQEYAELADAIKNMHLHVQVPYKNPPALLLKNRFVALGFSAGIKKAIDILADPEYGSRKAIVEALKNSKI
jgi:hypothetical protein